MVIHLTTLGGLRACRDGAELDRLLGQRLRAALFVYLAIERRVSREQLTTVFWPESSGENARHALRQSLYHLTQELGADWLEARSQELRLSAAVRTDAHDFEAALERRDVEAAARLYQGPFLNSVNLVALQPWESWVDGKRALYARGFRKACREWVEARRAAGDLDGAIYAAQRWVAPDPLDDEAQHRLIRTLADAGERAEAIRQYEVYARLLEPEGLRPLDETVELVERVRSEAAAWPTPASANGYAPARGTAPPAEESAGPRPAPERARVAWRPRVLAPSAILLLLALAAVWAIIERPSRSAPALSTTAVAVFPFSAHGGEEAGYFAEGMVNLLSTALDGAASLRPVDARAVFAVLAQQGGGTPDLDRGRRLAARLGAGFVVLGEVIQAGDRLQIEAAVYRADGSSAALSRAAVNGDTGELFDLVDRLAARLLAGLSDPSSDRLLRTAAVTTSSLPAFKAYLEGERLMRDGQFERAAEAFSEAIGRDSAYALAHYRLALAREWAPMPGIEESASDAARHAGRLSPRDRDLLAAYQAWRAGHAAEAERRYRAILARYPDDVEAWIQLGEILFHFGPVHGRPIENSEEAWRRVLAYEPRNLFALPHLVRIAALQGRVTTLDSLLAPFGSDEQRTDRRLVEARLLRALGAGDPAAVRTLVDEVRGWEDLAAWRLAVWVAGFSSDPAAVREMIQALDESHRSPSTRADLLWITSVLHLASGQVAAARDALTRAVEAEAAVASDRRRWALQRVSEWFAATLPLPYADSTLARVQRSATSMDSGATGGFENEMGIGRLLQVEPLRQYTLGLLALRLSDTAAAQAAAALTRLAASPAANALVRDLDRGLQARIGWQHGRAQEALALLDALELEAPQGDLAVTPFASRANERFLRAEVLEALGRESEALSWLASLGKGSVAELPFAAPAHLRQAEIHERLGNRAAAARHYTRFIELWKDSDPEFQPLVSAARRQLAGLVSSGGT